jgi:hypothetical protein
MAIFNFRILAISKVVKLWVVVYVTFRSIARRGTSWDIRSWIIFPTYLSTTRYKKGLLGFTMKVIKLTLSS